MQKIILIVVAITGALGACMACMLLFVDWFQAYLTGFYANRPTEVFIGALSVVLYTYFGVRFFYRHIDSFR